MQLKAFIVIVFLVVIFIPSYGQRISLEVDTIREFILHLPEDYDGTEPLPILFAFHGGFGFSGQFENESGLSDLADEEKFIVVYPQALGSTRSWNTGACCGYAFNNNINDILFVERMIEYLNSNYSIDPDRIYATGFSSGAMMTYAVACKLSHLFAAVAPVSSSMIIDECSPECSPVPIIHIHSAPDSSALFYGGYSANPLLRFYYPPVDSVMRSWAMKNECEDVIDTIRMENGTSVYRWNNCANNSFQEIWLSEDGGHKWPGTSGEGILSGDMATQDFSATHLLWNFVSQFENLCTVTSSSDLPDLSEKLAIFPNPVKDIVQWSGSESTRSRIYDGIGQLVLDKISNGSIDVSHLGPGIYYLSTTIHQKRQVVPFIKL